MPAIEFTFKITETVFKYKSIKDYSVNLIHTHEIKRTIESKWNDVKNDIISEFKNTELSDRITDIKSLIKQNSQNELVMYIKIIPIHNLRWTESLRHIVWDIISEYIYTYFSSYICDKIHKGKRREKYQIHIS